MTHLKTRFKIGNYLAGSLLLTLLGGGLWIYQHRLSLERALFEKALNRFAGEYFQGPIRLTSGSIDRSLKIHMKGVEGVLISEGGPTSIHFGSIDSEAPLTQLFSKTGVSFSFKDVRPSESRQQGIQGRAEVRAGAEGFYKVAASVKSLDLSELQWLNPENLNGSSGPVSGTLHVEGNFQDPTPRFSAVLLAEAGGTVQSRFFDVILPYLPEMPTKKKLAKLARKETVVPFKNAALRMELASESQMKVFLHILVPDYNVELNINLQIRIDETSSFSELVQVLGFIKVKS